MIQQLVEPTKKLVDVVIPSDKQSTTVEKFNDVRNTGLTPLIYYNGHLIPWNEIIQLRIDGEGFIPYLSLSFTDSQNVLYDKGFPIDNTIISFFLKTNVAALRPYRMDFKILSYQPEMSQGMKFKHTIIGILDVDHVFLYQQKSYGGKTSFELLKQFAADAGLGYASNMSSTDDSQRWFNWGEKNMDFAQWVCQHGYKSENSWLDTWIDFYYYLNYIDMEEQMRSSSDGAVGIQNGPKDGGLLIKNPEPSSVKKIALTNDLTQKGSDVYFDSYEIYMDSTQVSIEEGYRKYVVQYDIRGNWIPEDGRAGKHWQFKTDPFTTPGAENNKIILRGRPSNDEFFNQHSGLVWTGRLDTDSDINTGNVHRNFLYAPELNKFNKKESQKLYVKLELSIPNFNLYRGLRINVGFHGNTTAGLSERILNESLTGEWTIIGISFEFKSLDGRQTQIIRLVKRELNVWTDKDSNGNSTSSNLPAQTNNNSSNTFLDNANTPNPLEQLPKNEQLEKQTGVDPSTLPSTQGGNTNSSTQLADLRNRGTDAYQNMINKIPSNKDIPGI